MIESGEPPKPGDVIAEAIDQFQESLRDKMIALEEELGVELTGADFYSDGNGPGLLLHFNAGSPGD